LGSFTPNQAVQCGLFQKCDPNPQCWTSHLGFNLLFHFVCPGNKSSSAVSKSVNINQIKTTFSRASSAFKKRILKDFLNSDCPGPRSYRHKQLTSNPSDGHTQGVYIIRIEDFVFRRVQWLHTRGR
jgi:hypothetical protein